MTLTLFAELETLNDPFLQDTEIDLPYQPERNNPLYQETESNSHPEGQAPFHVEKSQNTFAVTTDEDTAFPHHVTARSVIPTSDVDAYQAQHPDTFIG